jgi:hypothetical protein
MPARRAGAEIDGRVYGINLPESAIDIDIKNDKTGFTCEKYFAAELENVAFARKAFVKSHVVQYVNFWPCEWNNDKKFMSRAFEFAHANGIGLGGPDIVPYKKGQMKNAYPFFHQYKGKLKLVAMAVQEPTLTYTNPETKKPFTATSSWRSAEDYLGVDIIFWATASPWLRPDLAPPRRWRPGLGASAGTCAAGNAAGCMTREATTAGTACPGRATSPAPA